MKQEIRYNGENIIEAAEAGMRLLDDKKAMDTVLLDLGKINSYFEYFLITTGNSHMHCKSLAKNIVTFFNKIGMKERHKPDYESEWIVVDFNELIIHVFSEEKRNYYIGY